MKKRPLFTVISLFGLERAGRSLADAATFQAVVRPLYQLLSQSGIQLHWRGHIPDARDRNRAPRGGKYSDRVLASIARATSDGRFTSFELFDPAWSKTNEPSAYGQLVKLWDYDPDGNPIEQTDHGAQNCVVAALHASILPAESEQLKAFITEVGQRIGAFVGYVEREVPWDVEDGVFAAHMIDTRFQEIPAIARRAQASLLNGLPQLRWGNLLTRKHMKVSPSALNDADEVLRLEPLFDEVYYLQLARDPRKQPRIAEQMRPLLKVIPEA